MAIDPAPSGDRRHDAPGPGGLRRRFKDAAARVVTGGHVMLYRRSGGRVGGQVAGMPVLLLTARGRRSGRPRTTPLTYFERDGAVVLVASYGGDDRDPVWLRNVRADPAVEVTRGSTRQAMTARIASGEEKARWWPGIVATYDGYRRYQDRTARDIPLVVLTPA